MHPFFSSPARFLLSLSLLLCLAACTAGGGSVPSYHIGVSQCSGGDWRDKMNNEMRREAIFHPGLTFTFCNAEDDYETQVRQIDSLAQVGVDLLVVAPIDSIHLCEAVARVRRAGIPVIVTDRRLVNCDYEAFVGGDNFLVGCQAVNYVASHLPQGGQIVEIRGHDGSTPAEERHAGLMFALGQHPELKLMASVDGYWLRDTAKVRMEELIHQYPDLRAVIAHNDYMAFGAKEMTGWVHKAQREHGEQVPDHSIVFVGVDAVYGPHHGLEQVASGFLDASILYPTGGDVVVERAVRILEAGRPRGRWQQLGDTILHTFVVSGEDAALLNDMDMAVLNEVGKVNHLQERESRLLKRLDLEQWLLVGFGVLVILLVFVVVLLRRHYTERRSAALRLVHLNRQLRDVAHQQLVEMSKSHTLDPSNPNTPYCADSTRAEIGTQPHLLDSPIDTMDPFLEQVYHEIERNYSRPDFGVEYLSVQMEMSRTTLYRKVKLLSGVSPLDLIREVRFREAKRLFRQGLTAEQIAPRVGFSSATYFIKCYDEYLRSME